MLTGTKLKAAAWIALLVCVCPCGTAQKPEPPPMRELKPAASAAVNFPFDEWISSGEATQIPWQVEVDDARLAMDQRLRVAFRVLLDAKLLNRRSETHDLQLIARVRPADGRWFPSHVSLRQELTQALPQNVELEFAMEFYAVPGKYVLGIVLYDDVTRERSVYQRPLTIPPLKNDPLPSAFQQMPAVEFLGETVSDSIRFSFTEKGRLWLPVRSERPLQVDLLINLDRAEAPPQLLYESPWMRRMRRTRPQPAARTTTLLSMLKALADLRIENGSLHVTALDLNRRVTAFQQPDVRQMDWPGLVEAVKKNNEPTISADALSGRQQNATFFRDSIASVLARAAHDENGSAPTRRGEKQPVRVLIILSEAMVFAPGTQVPVVQPTDGKHIVFHLRHMRTAVGGFDDLDRILKPLKPHRFDVITARDFRRALQKIIDELERL